ncbi:hypothetical protein [Serratia aquatilis]|uniref:Lipoprotein n=1 Tax=Serratia aquatilis TaxID=1737515 RepID=A0ABV6E9C1_9GAMM
MKIIVCSILVILLVGCTSIGISGGGGSSSATIGLGTGVRF